MWVSFSKLINSNTLSNTFVGKQNARAVIGWECRSRHHVKAIQLRLDCHCLWTACSDPGLWGCQHITHYSMYTPTHTDRLLTVETTVRAPRFPNYRPPSGHPFTRLQPFIFSPVIAVYRLCRHGNNRTVFRYWITWCIFLPGGGGSSIGLAHSCYHHSERQSLLRLSQQRQTSIH